MSTSVQSVALWPRRISCYSHDQLGSGCVIAYGQTGSGKTYSIFGEESFVGCRAQVTYLCTRWPTGSLIMTSWSCSVLGP